MDYISTWFCADKKGEESNYAQTGELSSSSKHQNIYWRCIAVFYYSSIYFNSSKKHVFFCNLKKFPVVDGVDFNILFNQLGVEIVYVPFEYKTPENYFGSWRNQFYIFSVLKYISQNHELGSKFLILDSDCVFTKSATELFEIADNNDGFCSYIVDYGPEHVINGISRLDMKLIFEELLHKKIAEIPEYHGGEFLMSSIENIHKISKDFEALWPILLNRNENDLKKLNEEAHTLSFLYFKNNLVGGNANKYIKRLWTNPVFYRNIKEADQDLTIWHLPSEKLIGFKNLFDILRKKDFKLDYDISNFQKELKTQFSIPNISFQQKIHYYISSYKKAIKRKFAN